MLGLRLRAALLTTPVAAAVAVVGLVPGSAARPTPSLRPTGYWQQLLSQSSDLGPAAGHEVRVLVTLALPDRPVRLLAWAASHDLQVRWQRGYRFAVLLGSAGAAGSALGVDVHTYRTPHGQAFLAAATDPVVPTALRGEVVAVGRVATMPALPHLENYVPSGGVSPSGLVEAYGAEPLAHAGYTGSGETIVFFEWGPFAQSDLDKYTQETGLPQFSPTIAGGSFDSSSPDGETTMDIEVAHAIAPDAHIVVYNANSAGNDVAGIAQMFTTAAQQFPGAVWSLSIGWWCDAGQSWSSLQAVDQAIAGAEQNGTTMYDASGDTGGLECAWQNSDWGVAPTSRDFGVDAIASLPSSTSVGGTALSVDQSTGAWLGETAWTQRGSDQGSAGGFSTVIPRPTWQVGPGVGSGLTGAEQAYREVPDVSADADPVTGAKEVFGGQDQMGGGTSQAAPIWAGLTALMDQYLTHSGGKPVGDINPILYHFANSQQPYPPLHDVTLGANSYGYAGPGYDLVTGLGTPDTYNLALDILAYQKGGGR